MKKLEIAILTLIIVVGFALRLYKIDRPIADWHSWRQADTAAVSRNFIKEGFNPLIPKFDDMSSQANGLDNPNRYRFVEFPIYNVVVALVWKITGVEAVYARLTTAVISLISCVFLYLITRGFYSSKVALLSAFFFATIPYNVFYSTSILPGPFMVMSTLGLYYSFINFLKKERFIYLILSIVFANLALLSWPVAAFFFVPLIYLAMDKYRLNLFKNLKLWFFAVFSVTPLIAWRVWILNYPEGIPNWQFLLNEGGIRFKGAFFRWIFFERMGNLILAFGGVPIFFMGVIKKVGREKLFYLSILASCLLYVSVFASGNVRHDYYQVPIIPALAIFMAIGVVSLFDLKSDFINKYIGPPAAIFLIFLMYAFGYYQVKGFYWINRPEIVDAGRAADKLLPKDAKVLAPYGGDAAFLYQTNRAGYPVTDRPLSEIVNNGAKYLVSVDTGDAGIQNLAKNCTVLEQTNTYLIVELSNDCVGKK